MVALSHDSSYEHALQSQIRTDRGIYLGLATGVLAGLLAPLLLQNMPAQAKIASWVAAAAGGVTLSALTSSDFFVEQEDAQKSLRNLRRYNHNQLLAYEAQTKEIHDQSHHQMEIVSLLAGFPAEVRNKFLIEQGLGHLISLFEPPPAPQAAITPSGLPINGAKTDLNKLAEDELVQQVKEWSVCKYRHVFFAGGQGDGKTNAVHFALYCWVWDARDGCAASGLIVWIYDPHYGSGRTDNYKSTWLGLPKLEKLPVGGPVSGVYQPEDDEDFVAWLDVAYKEYEHRRKTGFDKNSGAPPILVASDEMTKTLPNLNPSLREYVQNMLVKLCTGGPKFNIWLWTIVHDVAQAHTDIPIPMKNNSEWVLGASLAQSKPTIQMIPRHISDYSVENLVRMVRGGGTNGEPVGFVTTMPAKDGILLAPLLSNKEMESKWIAPPDEVFSEASNSTFDREFKAKYGVDPDDIIEDKKPVVPPPLSPDKKQETQKPTMDQVVQALRHCEQDAGRRLTDDEIKMIVKELTGVVLNEKGLEGFKSVLGYKDGAD